MKTETLLEKAKKTPIRKARNVRLSDEQYELFVAWAKGEVTLTQASVVLNCKSSGSFFSKAALAFKHYVLHNPN